MSRFFIRIVARETFVNIRGKWRHLYRVTDEHGIRSTSC